jgi:hypothetical protein
MPISCGGSEFKTQHIVLSRILWILGGLFLAERTRFITCPPERMPTDIEADEEIYVPDLPEFCSSARSGNLGCQTPRSVIVFGRLSGGAAGAEKDMEGLRSIGFPYGFFNYDDISR